MTSFTLLAMSSFLAAPPEPATAPATPVFMQESEPKKDDAPKKRKPNFTIGKDTTYVEGPVGKDGYIDYEAALNERMKKGATPENNSNVLLWKAMGPAPEGAAMPAEFYRWLGIEEPPEQGDYLVGMEKYIREHLKITEHDQANEVRNLLERVTSRPWKAADFPQIAGWIKANEKPLALVVEAGKRSHYFSPLVSRKDKGPASLIAALLPGVQKCREFTSLLAARAMLHLGEGRPDQAWQDLQACHRLARHVVKGATLIEGLVGIAIETIAANGDLAYLAHAKLTTQQIQARLRDLQHLPALAPMADKLDTGERFMFLDSVKLIEQGGLEALERMAGAADPKKPPSPFAQKYFESINWDPALRTANKWYDRLVAMARIKDYEERHKTMLQFDHDIKELKVKATQPARMFLMTIGTAEAKGEAIGNILICLLMPAVLKVKQAEDRTEQVQNNLQLAFALAAYRAAQGRYPEQLEALAPKYLAKVPADVFTGKSVIYRPAEDGYLLYSVGPNRKDDEGRWHDDDPPGDDPNVRMPLPALRPRP